MTDVIRNRLAGQASPYLLQHQHNPVAWQPWDQEALRLARELDRPIFLSVGYATCYWCHVMERECFEQAEIAVELNDRFVCIKVDRELRSDFDEVYMTATRLMTSGGGWPMSVFLTPTLEPIWCGTYLPPVPGRGLPSLPQVAKAIGDAWNDRREECVEQGGKVIAAIRNELEPGDTSGSASADDVHRAAGALLRMVDRTHGGIGGAPKFPQVSAINLLLQVAKSESPMADEAASAIELTLDQMARGGIYDQIGGGFHRYSVDGHWRVPHFEKMLYDNGQLLSLYADYVAWRPEGDVSELARRVLRETSEYLLREMTDASGAFWSAQDAEVEHREGGNYVWTAAEVADALGDETLAVSGGNIRLADAAKVIFGLDAGPNFQDPHHPDATPVTVLHQPDSMAALAGRLDEVTGVSLTAGDAEELRHACLVRLYDVRARRPQPITDDKVLTSWNGLAIKGLADSGRVLSDSALIDAAARAAESVLDCVNVEGGLRRSMREGSTSGDAVLEDYADLAVGLLALARAGDSSRDWVGDARELLASAEKRLALPGNGFYGWADNELPVRGRSLSDGATACGNSQMVHAWIDLAELSGEVADRNTVDRLLGELGGVVSRAGASVPHLCTAILRLRSLKSSETPRARNDSPANMDLGLNETAEASGPRCGPDGCTT